MKPDLCFSGVTLVEVVEDWHDERNLPLRPDRRGVYQRLAIYLKGHAADPVRFVAEQLRCNAGPVIVRPDVRASGGLPFLSFAAEFGSFDEAAEWIIAGQLINDGNLRDSFAKEVERYRREHRSPL